MVEDPNKIFSTPFKIKELLATNSDNFCCGIDNSSVSDVSSASTYKNNFNGSSPFLSKSAMRSESMTNFLCQAQASIAKFWTLHSERFVMFWEAMSAESRENFIRQACPNIVQCLSDRYCIMNGKREYRNDYNEVLILAPYLNVRDLSFKNHLIRLIEKYSSDSILVAESSDFVLKLRNLFALDIYPFSPKEKNIYLRELSSRKGDILYLNEPEVFRFGEIVEIDSPLTLLDEGSEVSLLYASGYLLYPIEFKKVSAILQSHLLLLTGTIKVFSAIVLSRDAEYLRRMTSKSLKSTVVYDDLNQLQYPPPSFCPSNPKIESRCRELLGLSCASKHSTIDFASPDSK